LIRRIIKIKNDQDQLATSGLSFKDIETIIAAFMQVYAGHFHERIKYPDANPV
jgi:membrane-associated HD superfamily phosphohydrolase